MCEKEAGGGENISILHKKIKFGTIVEHHNPLFVTTFKKPDISLISYISKGLLSRL